MIKSSERDKAGKKMQTAQDYIKAKLIDITREKIFDHTKTVSEIAFKIGFKFPQRFLRLFK